MLSGWLSCSLLGGLPRALLLNARVLAALALTFVLQSCHAYACLRMNTIIGYSPGWDHLKILVVNPPHYAIGNNKPLLGSNIPCLI